MVLWELLALQLPWRTADLWLVVGEVVAGRRPPIPAAEDVPGCVCYDRYTGLLRRCWAQEPAERPEFEEVCTELR